MVTNETSSRYVRSACEALFIVFLFKNTINKRIKRRSNELFSLKKSSDFTIKWVGLMAFIMQVSIA